MRVNGKNKGTFAAPRALLHRRGAKLLGMRCKSPRKTLSNYYINTRKTYIFVVYRQEKDRSHVLVKDSEISI